MSFTAIVATTAMAGLKADRIIISANSFMNRRARARPPTASGPSSPGVSRAVVGWLCDARGAARDQDETCVTVLG